MRSESAQTVGEGYAQAGLEHHLAARARTAALDALGLGEIDWGSGSVLADLSSIRVT